MTDSVQAPSPNAAAPALEGEAAFTRWQRMGNALRAGYVVTQRLARGLVTAVHSRWRRSLQLRVVTTTLMASVLVTEPQILVCDEPTTLLDLRNVRIITETLRTLRTTRDLPELSKAAMAAAITAISSLSSVTSSTAGSGAATGAGAGAAGFSITAALAFACFLAVTPANTAPMIFTAQISIVRPRKTMNMPMTAVMPP